MSMVLMLLGPASLTSQGADPCTKLKERLDKEANFLLELTKSYQELNRKFEETVQQDFTAQTEGFFDELRRNEAVKVAFARKRLARSLELKKEEVSHLRKLYCPKCLEKNLKDPQGRCVRCPDDKTCQKEEELN